MTLKKRSVKASLCLIVIFLLCGGPAVLQEANEVRVTRWNNNTLSGTFDGFTENGEGVLLKVDGKTRAVRISELLKLEFDSTGFVPSPPTALHLRGGEELRGEIMKEGKDSSVFLNAPVLREARNISLTWVDQVEFTSREGNAGTSETAKSNDILYKTNGDRYRGFLTRVSPDTVKFEDRNLGEKSLSIEKVHRIDLAPVGPEPTIPDSAYLEVHGAGGSILRGTPVSSEGSTLVLSGLLKDAKWTIDLKNVRSILIKNGKTTFLSDREPVEVVQKQVFPWQPNPDEAPDMQKRYHWRTDRAVPDYAGRSEPLKMHGTIYEKGIGCTPYTKLTYALNGSFRTFEATIGLDDQSQHPEYEGSVVFRVYVDGKEQYSSGTFKQSMQPEQIKVDVSGADRMSIEVDMGTGYLDFADWADARLIRDE